MHGIAQMVLTPMDLLRLSVHANPAEVDGHHLGVTRYMGGLWLLLRWGPTRHRECSVTVVQQERSAGLETDENR